MKKKIFISLILASIMFVVIGLTTSVNASTDAKSFKDELKSCSIYQNENDILLDNNQEDTVILNNNIKLTNALSITSGNIVLDLNGYTIDTEDSVGNMGGIFNVNGEGTNFTIIDSSESQKGTIKTTGSEMFFLEKGNLKIEAGTYIANYQLISAHSGKLEIDAGNFKTEGIAIRLQSLRAGENIEFTDNLITEINGGNFKTEDSSVISINGGSLTINGGNFSSQGNPDYSAHDSAVISIANYNNIDIENKVIINDGNITSEASPAIYIGMIEEKSNIPLIINSGTFISKQNQAIVILGKENGDELPVTINNGIFKSETNTAIDIQQKVLLTIKNGKFSGDYAALNLYNDTVIEGGEFIGNLETEGSTGIYYNMGNVEIKGGTFKGTQAGLSINPSAEVNLKLAGGTYIATGKEALGGVIIWQGNKMNCDGIEEDYVDDAMTVNMVLKNGYRYNDNTTKQKYIETQAPEDQPFKEGEYDHIYFDTTVSSVKVIKEEEFSKIILVDEETKTTLEGLFNQYPKLIVKAIQKGINSYDSIVKSLEKNQEVIGAYDVSVEGGEYKEKLNLTFLVNSKFEGQNIKIYHKLSNEEIEIKEIKVKDGKISIEVDELSPFVLTATVSLNDESEENNKTQDIEPIPEDKQDSDVGNTSNDNNTNNTDKSTNTTNNKNPQTGDNIILFVLILSMSVMGLIITLKVRKNYTK